MAFPISSSSHFDSQSSQAVVQEYEPPAKKKHVTIAVPSDLPAIKEARETLVSWVDVLSDRLAFSRKRKGDSDELEASFLDDHTTFDKYKTVVSYLKDSLSEKRQQIESDAPANKPVQIFVLKSEGVAQGMSASTIKADQVYLNALASAPWNIAMHAPVAEDHAPLSLRGAGKGLMAATYKLAQSAQKPRLCTTPLASAFTFYKGIGMEFNQDDSLFTYNVTDELPEALQAYAKIPEEDCKEDP